MKKLRSYQVWKLRQNFVTKVSLELRLKVTLELRYKYYVRITLGSFVRLLFGIQMGKKDTHPLHNGLCNYNFLITQFCQMGMVSFFTLWPKSSRPKSKYFIFFGSMIFQSGSHSLTRTLYIAAATWLHVSPISAIHVQWQVLMFTVYSSIFQSLWNGSFIEWNFLHPLLMIQYLVFERLWHCMG